MSKLLLQMIILGIISIILFLISYHLLIGILGGKGLLGLFLFCAAYKISTTPL